MWGALDRMLCERRGGVLIFGYVEGGCFGARASDTSSSREKQEGREGRCVPAYDSDTASAAREETGGRRVIGVNTRLPV
eukprot:3447058-Rhodomonas_salina.2